MMDTPFTSRPAFRWVCYGTAVLFGVILLWMIADLRAQVKESLNTAQETAREGNRAMKTVNEKLPQIVTEVKKGTETLAELSEDVKLIKSVAGVGNDDQQRGLRGLALYADALQKVFAEQTEGKEAVILLEKIFGADLKKHSTADEFLVALNKEMVTVILPLSKSREEILWRVCTSAPPRRVPFHIQFPDQEPIPLEQFLREKHPASAELPEYQP